MKGLTRYFTGFSFIAWYKHNFSVFFIKSIVRFDNAFHKGIKSALLDINVHIITNDIIRYWL